MGGLNVDELEGIILWHNIYGYCKILNVNPSNRTIEVQYCGSTRRANYAASVFGKDLQHKPLPLESFATVAGRGTCQLIKTPPPAVNGSYRYVVRFDETGDTAEFDEREIAPVSTHPKETLMSRMGACDPHALYKVTARHNFLVALEDLHKETGGLETLIGSRIELFPHQAFVAGTVINDPVRRFILADEVGLGKTVEAGLVINDLLAAKPDARVLILTPGALSRQWLCEMHISFGAQGFKLMDLYKTLNLESSKKLICSINRATFTHKADFEKVSNWDLVVVDEAHHLLWSSEAYQLVEKLSRVSNGLLLLSAVPAREREDELLRLLRLLDPERYGVDKQVSKRFAELYRAQPQLGQGLRILDRDLVDLEKNEIASKDLGLPLGRIMGSPVIRDDAELHEACRNIVKLPEKQALVEARRVRDLIVNRYRLSRRIIKNRRSQLISQELLQGVQREYEVLAYEPDAFEIEARLALENLLEQLTKSNASLVTKHVFFRIAYSAMANSVCASSLAEVLMEGMKKKTHGKTLNLLATSFGASYDEYYDLLKDLSAAAAPHLEEQSIKRFFDSVNAWIDAPKSKRRFERLLASLPQLLAEADKIIIFAGAYGSAEYLADDLKERLGGQVVEVFTFNLGDAEKEQNVLKFRTKKDCKILVSDETGGEGRNFQFADLIIHYDLPWSVAAIEQRIGRLDRIGRTRPVKSYVLSQANSIEEGFVVCLANGLQVFTTSISGLEFMLRDVEAAMVDKALTLNWEELAGLAPEIAEKCDAERRTDDAEALTDAASFPGYGKIRYLHEISSDLEDRLENSFVAYFRSIAQQGSARQYADDQEPNLKLWRFKPDEVRNEKLPGIEKGQDGLFAERRGTFRRLIARDRRNLEFFSVGNPLFNAVASVALDRLSGRVFAMEVCDPEVEAANYLMISMRCTAPATAIANDVALQRRVVRYFFGKRLYLAYRLGETEILKQPQLAALMIDVFRGAKASTDLGQEGFHKLVESGMPDWTTYLHQMQDVATADARLAYQGKYGVDHANLMHEVRSERAELERSPSRFVRDVEALGILERAFDEWHPVIDVIGVMQVSA